MPRVKFIKAPPELVRALGIDRFPVKDDRLEALRRFSQGLLPTNRKEN